jgi:hypothetical protein
MTVLYILSNVLPLTPQLRRQTFVLDAHPPRDLGGEPTVECSLLYDCSATSLSAITLRHHLCREPLDVGFPIIKG